MSNKKLSNKKSQAALEFLTTYAWAFLVIMIMVGALAYFGILNPAKLLPSRCNFGAEMGCEDYAISIVTGAGSNDLFRLRLKNNVGEPITVQSWAITKEDGSVFTCIAAPYCTALPATASWGRAEIKDVTCTCDFETPGFTKGNKAKILVTLNFYLSSSSVSYGRQVSGEVYTIVI